MFRTNWLDFYDPENKTENLEIHRHNFMKPTSKLWKIISQKINLSLKKGNSMLSS